MTGRRRKRVSQELGIRGRSRSEIVEHMARSLKASQEGTVVDQANKFDNSDEVPISSPLPKTSKNRGRSRSHINLITTAQAPAINEKEIQRNEEKVLLLLQEKEDEVAEATDRLKHCRKELTKYLPRVLTDYDRVSVVSGSELKNCFSLITKKMAECHRKRMHCYA